MKTELHGFTLHPAANEFPMMEAERLADLIQDIRINGQREPVRLYRGQVLDGRNRILACHQLGVFKINQIRQGFVVDRATKETLCASLN